MGQILVLQLIVTFPVADAKPSSAMFVEIRGKPVAVSSGMKTGYMIERMTLLLEIQKIGVNHARK